jgi:uncharacterized membrane protein
LHRSVTGQRAPSRVHRSAVSLIAAVAFVGLLAAPTLAVEGLEISTPFPGVAVAPGSDVSFDLTIAVTERRQVALSVEGVPTGWEATLRGGGNVVDTVLAIPDESPDVRLDVTIPADAAARTYDMRLVGRSGSLVETLPLSIRVNEAAAGDVTMTTDFPELTGPADATYSFSLTLSNDTAEDLTFALTATGPTGWTVTARPTSEDQAASATVEAGASETIRVEAEPLPTTAAGTYPLVVAASAGERSVESQLSVVITGNYAMTLTTPDGRLNASGNAGSAITRTILLVNDGTAPLTQVRPSATAPSGWTVTFEPEIVESIPPQQEIEVTSTIVPSGNAIAGDYVITYRASNSDSSASADENIRVTIETSLTWALVGVALILVTLAGLGWVFARYGRR